MPLLNYTTSIAADKTVAEIQSMLIKAGASAVLAEYEAGVITALSFKMKMGEQELSFRLPTDPKPVLELLRIQKRRNSRIIANEDQARRVAWRIVKDWVEAQLAIIQTRMVTTAQVFLPYAVTNSGQSLYEYIGQNTQLLLSESRDQKESK